MTINDRANKQLLLGMELTCQLKNTRREPGLSIAQVAEIIKKVFAKEEVDSLIEELQKDGPKTYR